MTDPVVEAFEAWATHPDRHGKMPIEKHPNGAYKDRRTYSAWYGWMSGVKHMPLIAVLNQDRTVSIVRGYHWEPMNTCPLGVTVQLKGLGGMPTQGIYSKGDDFWVAWAPFPTDEKAST